MNDELKLADPAKIREQSTKMIPTPQGGFLVRKLAGGELVKSKLITKLFRGTKGLTAQTAQSEMAKLMGDYAEDFIQVILAKCVVKPRIIIEGEITDPDNEISVEHIELDTFLALVVGVIEFSNFGGEDTFRGG